MCGNVLKKVDTVFLTGTILSNKYVKDVIVGMFVEFRPVKTVVTQTAAKLTQTQQ